MTTSLPLQQFAQQLATWAGQIIENGRTPFRRVDLFQTLQTAAGPCQPPLIFWINRQSLIAGGLVFLPDTSADTAYSREAAAAAALGLRHFVTWESDRVNLWEVASAGNKQVVSMPLRKTDTAATFHQRLFELTDLMKLYAVTGRVPNPELSPYYLLNLLLETLELSTPALCEESRLQRSALGGGRNPDEQSADWGRLSLIRLLCLLDERRLPGDLPPEALPKAIAANLPLLSAPLGERLSALSPSATLELPADCRINFHHLLLRLQQLGWQDQAPRREEVVRLLLRHWYPSPASSTADDTRLLLHPQELAPRCSTEVSRSGALLAANMLCRHIERQKHPEQIQGDAFHFNGPLPATRIHANLDSGQRPETAVRRELAGYLRASWPNRGLSIPGHLPYWASEVVHLLGLSAPGCCMELHLPQQWLAMLLDTPFCELLFDNFSIASVHCQADGRHLLTIVRERAQRLTECHLPDGSIRTLELGEQGPAPAALRYALELPAALYKLYASQQLVPLVNPVIVDQYAATLLRYTHSRLGNYCWQLLTTRDKPTTQDELRQSLPLGWLIPEPFHLEELARLSDRCKETEIDALLSELLALPADLVESEQIPAAGRPAATGRAPRGELGEDLLRQLEIEGIPLFPQTYLYRQETGPMRSFHFVPPLRLVQEMLGQYDLEDATGRQLHLTGAETKDALLLAGSLGLTSLELPQDRQMTATILEQYRQDLLKLQTHIAELCQRHIEQPSAAQRLQKKLWGQLHLPPAKWLSD